MAIGIRTFSFSCSYYKVWFYELMINPVLHTCSFQYLVNKSKGWQKDKVPDIYCVAKKKRVDCMALEIIYLQVSESGPVQDLLQQLRDKNWEMFNDDESGIHWLAGAKITVDPLSS